MSAVIIIPARMSSSRFPGKPLIDIMGKSLLQRVWEKCNQVFPTYVATEDEIIAEHCGENDMQCILVDTPKTIITGTDMVAEAHTGLVREYDTIINVQGDEPLIKSDDILKVAKAHYVYPVCGMCKIYDKEEFNNPNTIKVVTDIYGGLLYASRAGIPTTKNLEFVSAYKQVCIYAFSPNDLANFTSRLKTSLEEIEDIELLRVLETGGEVKMVEVSEASISVNVPDDVEKVIKELSK